MNHSMLKPIPITLLTVAAVLCAVGAQKVQITQPAGNITVSGGGGGGDAYLANTQTFTGASNIFAADVHIGGTLNAATQSVSSLIVGQLDLQTNIVAITNGGTGATNAAGALTNLGALSEAAASLLYQRTNGILTILKNLTNGTAGQLITSTGPGTFALSNAPSGGGVGDVVAAGNNTLTGTNIFSGMVTLGSLSRTNFLPSATEFYFFTEFITGTSGTTTTAFLPFQGNAINSGTAAAAQGLTNHPGIITLASATSANSGYAYTCNSTALIPRPGDFFRVSFRPFNTNAGVREYLGFHDQGGAASAPTDGLCLFRSNNIIYGQAWNNGTLVQTLNSASVESNAWLSAYGIVLDGTVAQFIVTDETGASVLTDTVTNGVPFTRGYGAGIVAYYTNTPGGSVNLGQYDNVHVGNIRNIIR